MHINIYLPPYQSLPCMHRDISGNLLPPKFLRLPSLNRHRSAPEMSITSLSRLKHSDTGNSRKMNVERPRCSLCGPRTRDPITAAWYPTHRHLDAQVRGCSLQARRGHKNGARTEQTPGITGGAVAGLRECLVVCKVKDNLPDRMRPSEGVVPIHYSKFYNQLLLGSLLAFFILLR